MMTYHRGMNLSDADRWLFLRLLWIDIAMERGVSRDVVARYMNEQRI